MSINVAIVEGDALVLGDLARLINSTEGLHCPGLYSSAVSALKEFSVSPPDMVLMDINLPGANGIESVRRVKAAHPDMPILVLTSMESTNVVLGALSAGAVGYLLKRGSPEQIIAAIRDVHAGGSPLTSSIARQLVGLLQETAAPVQAYQKLSMREQQVIDCLARGYSYQEIADNLKISYATAHTHIRHIYGKLQVTSRTDAVTLHMRHVTSWQVRPGKRQLKPVDPSNAVVVSRKSRPRPRPLAEPDELHPPTVWKKPFNLLALFRSRSPRVAVKT
jgi:DNA-binding NarL/FixJ family response regulator